MMALSTMRQLVDTLGDDYTSPIANEVLSRWAHDPGSARYIRASANFVFAYRYKDEPYILRFNHESERSVDWVQAELDFVRHLAARGIHVPQPVVSVAGREVESVSTSFGGYHAAAFPVIRGEQYDLGEMTPPMLTRWGQALGQLHNGSQSFQVPGRPSWNDRLADTARDLPAVIPEARELLRVVRARLEALPVSKTSFGLIHFDFEPDNLIWQEERVWTLDFDDSTYMWFVADLAFALRELFGDRSGSVDLDHPSVRAFVDGYRDVRAVGEDELALMPLFLASHNLVSFAKLQRTLGSTPGAAGPDEPEWLVELRRKLGAKAAFYREVFAETLESGL